MAQIAPITLTPDPQTTASQIGQSTSSENSFAPHLKEAASHTANGKTKNSAKTAETKTSDNSTAAEQPADTEKNSRVITGTKISASRNGDTGQQGQQDSEKGRAQTGEAGVEQIFSPVEQTPAAGNTGNISFFLQTSQFFSSAVEVTDSYGEAAASTQQNSRTLQFSFTNNTLGAGAVNTATQLAVLNNGLNGQAGEQTDAILNQLQKIIDSSSETGTVTIDITRQFSTRTSLSSSEQMTTGQMMKNLVSGVADNAQSTQTATLAQAGEEIAISPTSATGTKILAANSDPTAAALRSQPDGKAEIPAIVTAQAAPAEAVASATSASKEIPVSHATSRSQQAMFNNVDNRNSDIAAQLQDVNSESEQPQNNSGSRNGGNHNGGEANPQAQTTAPASQPPVSTASAGGEGSLFTSTTAGNTPLWSTFDNAATTTAQNSASTSHTLPSGTVVQEHEVLNQVINRFQITSRNMESRINIRLNPEELGEIKLDITVKEGSIRANVFAQSEATRAIVEKNLGRLKSILEEQGFTVEEIAVFAEIKTQTEFGLFGEEFSDQSNTDSSSPSRNKTSFRGENSAEQTEQDAPGVNLAV